MVLTRFHAHGGRGHARTVASCVAGALGVTDAGIFGDILCARMRERGVAGLVTDGVIRDLDGVLATGLAELGAGHAPHRRRWRA